MNLRHQFPILLLLSAAMTVAAQVPASSGQDPEKRKKATPTVRGGFAPRGGSARKTGSGFQKRPRAAIRQPDYKETFTVFAVRYADANTVASLLSEMLDGTKDVRISVDERTNRLFVFGDEKTQKTVSDVLKTLDVPKMDEKHVIVYRLKNIVADKSLTEILSVAAGNSGNYAIDAKTNSLIVSVERKKHDVVANLLERLDREDRQANQADQKWQIRVVWLIAGDVKDIGGPVPRDLGPVVKELERIGIRNPTMTSQVVVSASGGSEFSARGRAMLKEATELSVSGRLASRESNGRQVSPQLSITIDATKVAVPGRNQVLGQPIASIETSISAPIGHSVVLGVTPFEKMTSVFVVQIFTQ